MSVSRRFVAAGAVSVAAVALAISFSGVAAGASASLPSASVFVHANPGQLATKVVGTGCGGFIGVRATGGRGGSGRVACGHTSLSVPTGSSDDGLASPATAALICQANAMFASRGVDVICTENVD